MRIVRAEGLCKVYGEGENQVRAVDDVHLAIDEGEFVAVVGSSGSGKSTLLHLLGGLDRPTSGQVWVRDADIFALGEDALAVFRRRQVGFVFQAYNLLPALSVMENVTLPLSLDGRKIDEVHVNDVLETLGLAKLRDRLPGTLSGGQQQRVAIARALAARPGIILADEPTGNLDSKMGQEVITLMKASMRRYGQTLCVITHDERIAQMADRAVLIEDGRIVGGDDRA